MERLYLEGLEVRASGRTIIGLGLPYGELASDRPERFERGGLTLDAAAYLDLDHDPLRVVTWRGEGLSVEDTGRGLTLRAVAPPTPAGAEALRGIEAGDRRGLSVEFHTPRGSAARRTSGSSRRTGLRASGW